jgi:purine-binding chemotaxis protein CheW
MDFAKIRKKLRGSEPDSEQHRTADQKLQASVPESMPDKQIPEPVQDTESSLTEELQPKEKHVADRQTTPEEPPAETGESVGKRVDLPEGAAVEKPAEVEKSDETVEILTFNLLQEDFAFRISEMHEIIRFQNITKVPKTAYFILGITSLRGKIIPVIDLKQRLSLTDTAAFNKRDGKILIIKGLKGPIGVAVDKVAGVVNVPKSEILPPPSHLSETELRFIYGIAIVDKRFISIINMEEATALI